MPSVFSDGMSDQSKRAQRPEVPADLLAFNRQLIAELRANHGRLASGPMSGHEPMVLTTTGRRTGKPQEVVIGYRKSGDRILVIASANAAPKHPAWYLNLLAKPEATVEVGPEKFKVRARTAGPEERDELGGQIDYFARQQALTEREIPIVVLERI